jgi:molybdenum cofactor cytidylyltransferase
MEADGWLIALGDMPFIRPQTYLQVAEELIGGALLVAPTYAGQRGHPVGFSGTLGPELCRLSGDRGAQSLLRRYRKELKLFSCRDPGIVYDIDVPGDLLS